MLLPSISHEEIDTTSVHMIYWLHPLVLAVFGDVMLERAPGVSLYLKDQQVDMC